MKHWVSCRLFTVRVITTRGIVTSAAPIVAKFKGQPLDNLLRWAARQGGLIHKTSEVKQ